MSSAVHVPKEFVATSIFRADESNQLAQDRLETWRVVYCEQTEAVENLKLPKDKVGRSVVERNVARPALTGKRKDGAFSPKSDGLSPKRFPNGHLISWN